MTYITINDLYPNIRDSVVQQLIDNDQTVFAAAANQASSLARNYLNRYDIEAVFAKTGEQRNLALVHYIKSITLYFLYERACDDEVPDRVIKDYDDALIALKDVARGDLSIYGLPKDGSGTTGEGTSGSDGGDIKTTFNWGGEVSRSNTF